MEFTSTALKHVSLDKMWIIERFYKGNINLKTTAVLQSPILSIKIKQIINKLLSAFSVKLVVAVGGKCLCVNTFQHSLQPV